MKALISSFFFISTLFISQAQNQADDILGFWLTDDGRAKIEIYKESGKYSGKIVWLKDSIDKNGNPPVDYENPDPELRKRTIQGINLVKGFYFDSEKWVDGEIYDPDTGKTYASNMKLKRNKLEVRGFVGIPMFGRTVVWTKTTF